MNPNVDEVRGVFVRDQLAASAGKAQRRLLDAGCDPYAVVDDMLREMLSIGHLTSCPHLLGQGPGAVVAGAAPERRLCCLPCAVEARTLQVEASGSVVCDMCGLSTDGGAVVVGPQGPVTLVLYVCAGCDESA